MKKLLLSLACLLGISATALAATATINFGSANGSTKVDKTSVTGTDDQGREWTITTVMNETSFTQNAAYSQIGAAKKPATSITAEMTCTDDIDITSFEVKLGGFSDTKGDVVLKIGDQEVATGTLDGKNDVVVKASGISVNAKDKTLSVEVTNIDKGVKLYSISYADNGAPDPINVEAPVFSVTDSHVAVNTVVEISCATEGAVIYYTLDNSEPTNESTEYTEPIILSEVGEVEIKAIAYVDDNASPVSSANYIVVEPGEDVSYKLIKDDSDLEEGAEYLIVCVDESISYAMGAQTPNNRTAVEVSVVEETVTVNNLTGAQVVTLEGDASAWNLKVEDGYLYANGGDKNNYLKTESNVDDNGNANATISIDEEGLATILLGAANNARCDLRFNSSSKLFSCYASTSNQKKASFFKKIDSTDTGIQNVAADANAPVVYYNLQGVRVANPTAGVYVRVQGNKASKVLVK